jgi:hypothetical protein
MSPSPDRLYELLPALYRLRDKEQGESLRALLQVITEQVNVVESDIAQHYENLFIETCQDWVVPYIADLIGYQSVHDAGEPGDITTLQGQQHNKILIPRREVANTIRYRRSKGTLALLEQLAKDVTGWPVRAVEFYKLLGITQAMNHLRPAQGRTVDLRQGIALDYLDSPFDELAHTVDVRSIASHRTPGWYNIRSIGLFVWRLKAYSVTKTPAYCLEESGPHCYTFSVLGNDTPLYTRPETEAEPTDIAGPLNLPIPIRRRFFEERKVEDGVVRRQAAAEYYGIGKSLAIWAGSWANNDPALPIPRESIIPADLSEWHYRPPRNHIAVDPESGRIAFPSGQLPKEGVWVSYHYGFSADIGGGEYERSLLQPTERLLFDEDDFKDFTSLAVKLRTPQDPLSYYLKAQFSPNLKELLDNYDSSSALSLELQQSLITELNQLFQSGSLYNEQRFVQVNFAISLRTARDPISGYLRSQFSSHLQQLLDNYDGSGTPSAELQQALTDELNSLLPGGKFYDEQPSAQIKLNLQGKNLIRLNRWLLEQAYPEEITKSYILYRVSKGQRLYETLAQWTREQPRNAVIEFADSGVYVDHQINIQLRKNQNLQLRAANRTRPVIRLLNWLTDLPDSLRVTGESGSSFVLDGVMVAGRGIEFTGDLAEVTIRHSTLVPGWGLHCDCEPRRPAEPSLELTDTSACITIEHSIIGSIQVNQDEVKTDPMPIRISDSILDATSPKREALGAPGCPVAHALLTIVRSTVIGQIQVHAIDLAENSIFYGLLKVARRQQGCMRFCSYVKPGSRTPRRYHCQPDLVEEAVGELVEQGKIPVSEKVSMQERERLRVRPQFNSTRYGTPTYCQLADTCAEEIKRGADDQSEMGVFHDLYQPQRAANLRARLNEYTPAGSEAGIIYSN